ncbi:rod shape-determining protein MreD [Nocardioides sp. SYSU D00038]|uniref:rod shape-determining protein MreD n=1 Tax=Nocardioides sp. SYSU D00038 TaxID=2812554 RepID=UPI0019680165|nr:rod shape-determining protein MreD [Nocardioides sp. SYSU D00038]
MTARRAAVVGLLLVLALTLQASVLPLLSWQGAVPNLVLLLVVAVALVRGSEAGLVVGFVGGLLLDLAPPADHTAGRWALALLLVGVLAGRLHDPRRPRGGSPLAALGTVAAASFVATSVFALAGLVVGDGDLGTGDLLSGLAVALVCDLVVAPLVLPPLLAVLRHTDLEAAPA